MNKIAQKIISDKISPKVLVIGSSKTIELNYKLLDMEFERIHSITNMSESEKTIFKQNIAIESGCLKHSLLINAKIEGLRVSSVFIPKRFSGKPKTEAHFLNWLEKRVKSIHRIPYLLRLKYKEEIPIKLKYVEQNKIIHKINLD